MSTTESREQGVDSRPERRRKECFGCGCLTTNCYRDLPLCPHCEGEAARLNQRRLALMSGQPSLTAALPQPRISIAGVVMLLVVLAFAAAVWFFAGAAIAHAVKGAWG
jgi:hypothetical protein